MTLIDRMITGLDMDHEKPADAFRPQRLAQARLVDLLAAFRDPSRTVMWMSHTQTSRSLLPQ